MPEASTSLINGLLRFILAGCILAMAACDSDTSSTEYMSRAEQKFAKQKYAEAIIELKNALAAANDKQERLPRARWLLGKSYLESGDMKAAAKELERANKLGWNPNEVLPALAKALLGQGELTRVEELSSAGLEPQAAAQLQAQQALAQLGQGDSWAADTYIAKAVELQPNDTEVQLAKARMLGASGDIEGAMALLGSLLEAQPDNREAWSLKGDLLSRQQKPTEAVAAFGTAIKLFPDSLEDRFKRALINLYLQQLEAVVPDAEFLLTAAPKHPMSNYVQGSLEFHKGNYAKSITALELAEPAAKQYPLILFYLVEAHLKEGHKAEALRLAESQVSLNPNFAAGRKQLANMYLQNSKATDAQNTLRPVLDNDPTDRQALKLMAKALLLDGKTDQALKMLGTLQQMAPESAVANFDLGAGLMFSGQGDAANRQFEAALALDPSLEQADILRVLQLQNARDIKGAIAAAQDYVGRHPESVQAHSLLGQMYLANEQINEATAAFKKALSLAPGDPAANHGLAKIELRSGDTAASRGRYQAVLAERPDYLPTLLQLVMLEAELENEAGVVAQLQHAIDVHPDALEPRLMMARVYLRENTPARIPPLFNSLSELQQQVPEVLRLMAMSQLAEQQFGEALYSLKQLLQLNPHTALAHHLLATAAAGAGDMDTARVEFKRAHELDENFPPTLVALAKLAWTDGDAPLFDRYMQQLSTLAPNAPNVLRLRASAAERDGDLARAVELSRQVLEVAPGTTAMLELAGYLFTAGNSKDALVVMRDWVSKKPADAEARMVLASRLTILGQTDEAIQYFREVVTLQPKNANALNNLAWLLRVDQPREALEFARSAATLDPDGAGTLDTLALVESEVGNQPEALRHMKRAVAASPDNATLLYHQAMIEARSGNNATAIEILKNVLGGKNAAFAERAEAEQLLASLQ